MRKRKRKVIIMEYIISANAAKVFPRQYAKTLIETVRLRAIADGMRPGQCVCMSFTVGTVKMACAISWRLEGTMYATIGLPQEIIMPKKAYEVAEGQWRYN